MNEATMNYQTKKAIESLLKIGVPLMEAYRVLSVDNQKKAA